MNRRLLLRLALLSLVSTLVALVFAGSHGVGAARVAQGPGDKRTRTSLMAVDSSGKSAGECPLRHTDVKAEVSGFISRVNVTQEFVNPFDEKIEAVYTFPLPQAAAVDDMTMRVGDRTIKGKIMRREEAQAAYKEAKSQGHVASLLDQERPNVFTQSVANIMPGQTVVITISYVETLKYEGGAYEWSFPMVVGPRYVPAGTTAKDDAAGAQEDDAAGGRQSEGEPVPDASPVPDAARITPPVIRKGMRAGHDISVELDLDAGVPLGDIASSTHEIEVERPSVSSARVRLKDSATIPNKDFRLRYDVAGSRIEDAVLAHRSSRGGFFTLILQPPERVTVEDVTPKELVFVLDTSGSMEGFPLEKAKETMKLALEGLYPQDTFNLITFSGDTHILFDRPVPATPENLSKAKKFLSGRRGDGGTEMMKAIRAALAPSDSQDHVRVVCFMTDGQVGDDFEIISEVQKHPNARVFAMGFGDAPNRFLLDKMAEYGRGEVEYVTEADDGAAAVRRFHERVRNPLLTDLSVEWSGLDISDVYPKLIPDLFSARPVILSGRYERGGRGMVRLKGKMSGRDFLREIPVELPEAEERHDVLATLWARRRVDDLMGRDMHGLQTGNVSDELSGEITRLGLDFRLMTQFTSFVAIEDRIVTDGGEPRRVDVPVEAPAGSVAVGVMSECVTVTSSIEHIDTTSTCTSTTVETRTIEDLPLKGRSLQTLVSLTPGAVGQPGRGEQGEFSVGGQRPRSNSFVIDGVSADIGIAAGGESPGASAAAGTTPGLTASGGTNGLASIGDTQEVSVQTYYVEPQFGRTPGAHTSVVTRAGTNETHGSVFGYFGHDALDANDWFANSRGARRPPRRSSDYGGTLGGPLKRDQTFFFFSYEGQRLRQPAFVLTQVPSAQTRAAAPDALRPLLNAFPLPNEAASADGFAEFAAGFANPARLDAFSFRVDDMMTSRLSVSARYNVADSAADERGAGGFSLNTLNRARTLAQTLTGSATYSISAALVAELRANYSRLTAHGSQLLDSFGGAVVPDDAESSNLLTSTRGRSFVFDLGGRGAALKAGGDAFNSQRQLNLVGSLDAVHGAHTFKFGADYRRLSPLIALETFEQDVYFDGAAQALADVATRVGVFTRTGPRRVVFNNLSAYAQDEWRATKRLTLTYGLRWEVNPAPSANDDGGVPAVTQVEDLSRLALAPRGTPLWRTTYGNFAPRAGFAYQLSDASGRELVLRGGFGLFYDMGTDQAGHAFADSLPTLGGGAVFGVPFPSSSTATDFAARVPLYAFDPALKLPLTLRWNLSVERALGPSQTFSAAYVGAAGRRLLLTRTLFDQGADFSFVRLVNNGAKSVYHSMQLQFNRRLSRGLEAVAAYTLSKSLDDSSQDEPSRAVIRDEDPRLERGPSDFDVRHSLSAFVSYKLPAPLATGLGNSLTRNWTLAALFSARSARPLNVVYSFPTVYGLAYLRPDLLSGVPLYLDDASAAGGRRINPAAFAVTGEARQGTLGRNALRGFPLYQTDLALRRQFNFTERVGLQLRAEVFNLLNHPNFEDPSGVDASLGSRSESDGLLRPNLTFGRSLSARGGSLRGGQAAGFAPFYFEGGPRTIQFSLGLTF